MEIIEVAKMTSKGQVTVPAPIREILNLKRGSAVVFKVTEKGVLFLPLREARKAAGLTQEELARRISTKKTAVSRIENHSRDIRLSTLEKVASALGKRIQIKIL